MAARNILLPYNFTQQDRKALEFVIQTFAGQKDVRITLFNAYTPVPDIETSGASVMGRLKANIGYLNQKILDQENALTAVKQDLIQSGFAEDRVTHIFKSRKKDIAIEITDLIAEGGYDLIVLNRKPGRVTRFFTGTTFNKVVNTLKGVTVCIVS